MNYHPIERSLHVDDVDPRILVKKSAFWILLGQYTFFIWLSSENIEQDKDGFEATE